LFTAERIALSPALWHDPDVRWLTGVHEAEGREYLLRERYEELLWWLLMPSLLRLADETAPSLMAANRAAVQAMSDTIEGALAAAEAVGYRVDLLRNPSSNEVVVNGQVEPADAETEPPADSAANPA
jgi:hypothetical protein